MNPVVERPAFGGSPAGGNVELWANSLAQSLTTMFQEYGFRLNRVFPKDGSETLTSVSADPSALAAGVDEGYVYVKVVSSKPELFYRGEDAAIQITSVGSLNTGALTGSALSVLGRASNSSGTLADIAAGNDDRLLRRTSSTLNFGQLSSGMFPNTVVPDAALSSNVPLIDASTNAFTGAITATSYGGILQANLLDKSANEVVSGAYTFSALVTAPDLTLNSAVVQLKMQENDAATDEGFWEWRANAGLLNLFTATDAGSASVTVLAITRSGLNVSKIAWTATEFELNLTTFDCNAAAAFTGDLGFYNTTPIAQQTGVAVSAAGVHAALVALGLITA